MAEELYYDKINRHIDWGGDENTGYLPVAGSAVQEFIKSELNEKIGTVYLDDVSSSYLCFANEEDRDVYLADRSQSHLVLGSFIAPSRYKAKVIVDSCYNAVLINSKENYLTFGYEITTNDELFVDNARYVVTITKNGNSSELYGTCTYGKTVSILMDEYLTVEGNTEITISITGQTTNAEAKTVVTYEVVNLKFESTYDVSKVCSLIGDSTNNVLVIDYSIFGTSNLKYIDWYIDGELFNTDTIQGGTVEEIVDNKKISVAGMSHGVHNVQFRAYVVVNGENFYTDTLYKEFMVIADVDDMSPMIAIENTIPREIGIVSSNKLYDVIQYESYTLSYGVYNPKNLEYIPVEIYLNDVLSTTVNAPNNKELSYTFTASSSGDQTIKFKIGDYEKSVSADVSETVMNLQEITSNLTLSLSALGRTNQDANREDWSYNGYKTTFTGFNWSSASGWNNNRLYISDGMSITTSIQPLATTIYGKTIEIEFETFNVTDDNAVICNLLNENNLGLLITASKAILTVGYGDKESVSTNYKANENVRISFVLDSINKLAIIYVNGIMSGAVSMTSVLNIEKDLSFIGTSESGIKIKQILVFDTQLSSEQILNNYILYRDSISEMNELYNRNDVVDGQLMSIDKLSDFIPVIILTGEKIFELEADKDTDREERIDVEYINKQDPTHQFKFYGGCVRIQGTSSAGYVRKNWRIYSKRKERYVADVYDWQGNLSTDKKRRIAFKEGAVPVNCWTLKADFAESSGTHNTGVATMWNDVMYNAYHTTHGYICRTTAQKNALENGYEYDCRTTVDGFPIVVFARRTEQETPIFMGKYNFNNDKSTENVFGFCDIPGFDDAYIPGHEGEVIPEGQLNAGKDYTYGNKMQCWEMRENYDSYALFQTTDGWHETQLDDSGNKRLDEDGIEIKSWATGFEARYPDDGNEADTSDLKAFADWLISCGDDHEKFAIEKFDHFDIWKIAAYYVYLMRFGAVDQVVKNSMFTSEDGQHWYYINYDNDTILGLDNSGNLAYPPTITRETPSGADYAYMGHSSRLWNMLEADTEFMTYYVPETDSALFSGGLTYADALRYFNVNQSDKWCERVYNQDAEYKYIKPYTNGTVNELVKMHGSRKAHRTWWLSKRFQLMDAKFSNINYRGKHIHMKLEGAKGAEFTIKASDYMYFGCEYNKNPWAMGVELNKGEEYTFYKPSADEDPVNGKDFAQGDPIYIYSPLYIEELDLSKISSYIYVLEFGKLLDEVTTPRMKKLIIGGQKSAKPVSSLSGLNVLTNLEYLDLTGIDYPTIDISTLLVLKTLILTDSTINTLTLPEGCLIEDLYLNKSLKHFEAHGIPNLKLENIHGFDTYRIPSINISNSPTLTNNFGYYYNWAINANKGDSLVLSGIKWTDISPVSLIEFGKLNSIGTLSLKGKIEISDPTLEQVEQLQSIFGKDCFTNNSELWISAPESVFVHGPSEMRSGDSQLLTTTIFSEDPGRVYWFIESGNEWVESMISNENNTGTLTTIEDENADHKIVIKAMHYPANSDSELYGRSALFEITSKKTIYSTSGRIIGNPTIKQDTSFTLVLGPGNYNGDYATEWEMTGDSIVNGDVSLENATNFSVMVKYNNQVVFEGCNLIAHVTNKNGTTHDVILPVTITDASVLMTSTSNPEVMAICYSAGWSSWTSPEYPDAKIDPENVMYTWQAHAVTDIGTVFRGGTDSATNKPRPGAYIKTFNEFAEFKNVNVIPEQAFFQCSNLTEIEIPINIQTIGSFGLGSTKITHLYIPNNVSSIYYTAFESTPIVEFEVGQANVTYKAINGVLIAADGTLVKYPEGKSDESYTTDASITKLNAWSIKNTKLRELTISDSVISHSDRSISDNKYLHTLNLGSNVSPTNLALHITGNSILSDINVSEDHSSLCSIDGVVYDVAKTTVWKYPEGRSIFTIDSNAKIIGEYAVSQCMNLSNELFIPDHIEIISQNGFYACQNLGSVLFSNTSKLTTLRERAFQLLSRITSITFPESLTEMHSAALGSCWMLGNIKFLGSTAPILSSEDVFGSESAQWTGRDAETRTIYVPADAEGYDTLLWMKSVFSEERVYSTSSGTKICKYTLSKTL